ncbi:MAG: hypothetical protein E6X81_08135 [Clostridium butyricum]|nr:hypothetical protein [Clostridium butyricum]
MNQYINKIYNVTEIEQNIIVGSLLGDGNLALYGRSKNAYYREHGCDAQILYRLWKCERLCNLDFRLNTNCKYAKLSSHSNIFFTELYNKFYINSIKTITTDNIKLLTHPIGLACFYMDDGTLVIDSVKRKDKSIYIFPRISLYTLSFSKAENIVIKDHLESKFGIKTKLKHRKDGKKNILEINKKEEIMKFISIVKPYVTKIPCMKYKIDLEGRFEEKKCNLKKLGYININSWNKSIVDNSYSKEDELFILKSKKNGVSTKQIAKTLNRPYWGVIDKLRRMKKSGIFL